MLNIALHLRGRWFDVNLDRSQLNDCGCCDRIGNEDQNLTTAWKTMFSQISIEKFPNFFTVY